MICSCLRYMDNMAKYYWGLVIVVVFIMPEFIVSSNETVTCHQPENFTIQMPDEYNIVVYNSELLIKNSETALKFVYSETNTITIHFDNLDIEWTGNMVLQSHNSMSNSVPKRVSWRNKGHVIGVGRLMKLDEGNYTLNECRLLPTNSDSQNLPMALVSKLQHIAAKCLEPVVCAKAEIMTSAEIQRTTKVDIHGQHAILLRAYSDRLQAEDQSGTKIEERPEWSNLLQMNVNSIMDMVLRKLTDIIKSRQLEQIKLPHIKESFSTGSGFFKVKGYFEANDGSFRYLDRRTRQWWYSTLNGQQCYLSFRDLSTIKRSTDAILSNLDQSYSLSCGLQLLVTHMVYNNYKLRYGIIGVNGEISGQVDKLKIDAKVYFDFNKDQCVTGVEYIKVTDMGKPNIKITGLGLLNSLASKLLNWVSLIYQKEAIQLLVTTLRNIADKELVNSFNCKKYRG